MRFNTCIFAPCCSVFLRSNLDNNHMSGPPIKATNNGTKMTSMVHSSGVVRLKAELSSSLLTFPSSAYARANFSTTCTLAAIPARKAAFQTGIPPSMDAPPIMDIDEYAKTAVILVNIFIYFVLN
jgi:hypothetical protein